MSNLNLPFDRYVVALKRLRQQIADGLPLSMEDSDCIGDKHTGCTWGLCTDRKESWPDAEDHLWPDQFTDSGRVAPKYRNEPQKCPMDKRETAGGMGCFYCCRIFQAKKQNRPDRAQTLRLYDEAIAKVQP